MRFLVSVEVEGASGVVSAKETTGGQIDYERGRRWLTADCNAAIAGALEADPSATFVLHDTHGLDYRSVLFDADGPLRGPDADRRVGRQPSGEGRGPDVPRRLPGAHVHVLDRRVEAHTVNPGRAGIAPERPCRTPGALPHGHHGERTGTAAPGGEGRVAHTEGVLMGRGRTSFLRPPSAIRSGGRVR